MPARVSGIVGDYPSPALSSTHHGHARRRVELTPDDGDGPWQTAAVLFATSRLQVRFLRSDDAESVAAYRNDPEIARYQNWELPYTIERAVLRLGAQDGLTAIAPGVQANLALERNGELIGDIFVDVDSDGASAEIGFTLLRRAQGFGFATEAAGALVDHLLERTQINRIIASLDPVNVASMRVLEAIGMQFECLARGAVFLRGAWVDDLRYAMTREERLNWCAAFRPPSTVSLAKVTDANLLDVVALRTHHSQERLVAPMAKSLAQVLVPPIEPNGSSVVPWYRAIVADDEIVGFVMLSIGPTEPDPFLWRLLIDRRHQRRGVGSRAIRSLAEQFRSSGSTALAVSWTEGAGSPGPFYEQLGFAPTGANAAGETLARLVL